MRCSINITVHNKEALLPEFLECLLAYTPCTHPQCYQQSELIFVFDGCTDNSEAVVRKWLEDKSGLNVKLLTAPDVFETKANNIAARESSGEYIAILQDDVMIGQYDWTEHLILPMLLYKDVFAVTGNTAHNWELNSAGFDTMDSPHRSDRWCDMLNHTDHASIAHQSDSHYLHVRQCVNRAPLMLRSDTFRKLDYFDEAFAPQDMDDHDLCMRAYKRFKMVAGCRPTSWRSRPEWGGTRDAQGKTKPWLFKAHHKNTRLFYERHRDLIGQGASRIETRPLFGNI